RVMTVGDFDQDGDIDLAGAGYAGDVVVFENEGNLLTIASPKRYDYERLSERKFGTKEIKAIDVNEDGDLDLVIGSGHGIVIYQGLDGILFAPSAGSGGVNFAIDGMATGNFDSDDDIEIAVSCRLLSCAFILDRSA